jgi:predicted permease
MVAWQARDRDIHQEMTFHLDSLTREYIRGGMPEAEARLAARRQFGSVAQLTERGHDIRGAGPFEAVGRELRHAARRLLRAPGFTLASVLTLTLAIGANVSIFTVVHRVVLNPLPYPESGRLVEIEHGVPRVNVQSGIGLTAGLYHQYLDRARTIDSVAVYRVGESTLGGEREPERIRLARTTASLTSVLGVPPVEGRWFTHDEEVPGAPQVAVVSHGVWMRRFGGLLSALGQTLLLDGVPTEIVGVMPPSFAFPDPRIDVWVPYQLSRAAGFGLPYSLTGVARLRDDAGLADLRNELDAIIADLPNVYPGDPGVLGNVQGGLRSAPLHLKDAIVGNIGRALWIVLAAVGVVLLVACANVANLFLVRSEGRQREIAVRRALGANGPGIARFFLAESLLLSAAGGALGLLFAWGAVRVLVALGPATLPRLGEVRPDGVVIGFAAAISLLVGVSFGAIPLWRTSSGIESLHESGRSRGADRRRHRARNALMGAQVALALVLLVASALMVRSFLNLRAYDPGFEPASAITFRLGMPRSGYATRDTVVSAHSRILDELAALPGVRAVAASTGLPLSPACFGNSILVEGRPVDVDRSAPAAASLCAITHDYVAAMGLRLLRGRNFTRDDVERREPVVLVNEAFVNRSFPQEDPIGKRIRSNAPPPPTARLGVDGRRTWDGAPPWLTIAGVVGNTPFRALAEPNPVPVVYMPMSIAGGPDIPSIAMLGPDVSSMSYVVRSAVDTAALLPSIRRAVDAVDPGLAISQVRELADIVEQGSAQMAFTMALLTIAAGVALLLGVVGIYGVVSYVVAQRIGEIGVRLALGAEPHGVVGMIVRRGLTVSLAGTAAGVGIALAGGRLVEALLYDVSPRDPGIFAATTAGVLLVAVLACWVPARRAAGVSPIQALRAE